MDFKLTELQIQLKAMIKDFCKREVDMQQVWKLSEKAAAAKNVQELREAQPWDMIRKMHELGLRQLAVPTEYGGGGFTKGENLTRVLLGEELGYVGGPVGRLLTKDWQTCAVIAGPNTTQAQKDWFFPKFMEDPIGLCAHSISEPQGTTDIDLPYDKPGVAGRVTAVKDGNEWVINGSKMFSSAGGVAQFIFTGARTDKEGPISKSMSLFWVFKDTPGLYQELNQMIMPDIYGNVQNTFDNCRVPEEHLIGELNQGHKLLTDLLGTKLLAFSTWVGYCQYIYEQVVEFSRQRIQSGKPIVEHSYVASILGEVAIEIEAVRAFLYKAAWEIDEREKSGQARNNFESIACFYLIKNLCLLLARVGCDVYGGIAGTSDLPLAKYIQHMYIFLAGGGPMGMDKILSSMWYNDHTLGKPWEKAK